MKEQKEPERWKGDKKDILASTDLGTQRPLLRSNPRKASEKVSPGNHSPVPTPHLKTQEPFMHAQPSHSKYILSLS